MVPGALAQNRLRGMSARVAIDEAEMGAADWARTARIDRWRGRIFLRLVRCRVWHGIRGSLGTWRFAKSHGVCALRVGCGVLHAPW